MASNSYKNRFLTITGHGQKREIVEATNVLLKIEREWWLSTFT